MNEPVIGIDLGGTKVLSAVVDASGTILSRGRKRTQKLKTGEDVFARLVDSAREAVAEAQVPLERIAGVGVGAPGPLDPATGIIEFTPNMGFRNFPLRDRLQEALGRPAFVNNDANLGVFGEWKRGAAAGARNVIGVFVGTGVGGGLILNGELFEGFNHAAGEIGHIVVELGGPRCGCGNHGCLESIASRTAIARNIYQSIAQGEKSVLEGQFKGDPPMVRSKRLARAFAEGDKVVCKVLDHAADVLGKGIGSLINLLSPEVVVIGGGVVEALGETFLTKIAAIASEWAFEVNRRNVRIVPAALGDDAIALGAAAYARMKLEAN